MKLVPLDDQSGYQPPNILKKWVFDNKGTLIFPAETDVPDGSVPIL